MCCMTLKCWQQHVSGDVRQLELVKVIHISIEYVEVKLQSGVY